MRSTRLLLVMLLTAPLFPAVLKAQRDTYAKYGLKTINTPEEYRRLIASDPRQEIVYLKDFIPGITLDVRYATANNLMHRPMYRTPAAFLRLAELSRHGYQLRRPPRRPLITRLAAP
jgi:D-alanyl-D-alanine dipeptidase